MNSSNWNQNYRICKKVVSEATHCWESLILSILHFVLDKIAFEKELNKFNNLVSEVR